VQDGPFRGHEGAARRYVRYRCPGPRCGDRVGEPGAIGVVGSCRDPTDRYPLRRRLVAGRTAG
jgi:hypothetical protein